jgi:hypothetical protein
VVDECGGAKLVFNLLMVLLTTTRARFCRIWSRILAIPRTFLNDRFSKVSLIKDIGRVDTSVYFPGTFPQLRTNFVLN